MGLHLALSMIDLTTLEGKDTPEKVKQLCYKAQHLHDSMPGLPYCCSGLCISYFCESIAKKELEGSRNKCCFSFYSFS